MSYFEYLQQQEAIFEKGLTRGRKAYFRSFFRKGSFFCHVQRMFWYNMHTHIFLCNGGFFEKRYEVTNYFYIKGQQKFTPVNRNTDDMLAFCDAFFKEIESLPNLRCKFISRIKEKSNSVFFFGGDLSMFEIEKFENEKGQKGFLIRKIKKTPAKQNFRLKHDNKAFDAFFKEIYAFYKDFRKLF